MSCFVTFEFNQFGCGCYKHVNLIYFVSFVKYYNTSDIKLVIFLGEY